MYFYIFSTPPPSYTPITLIALSEQMFTTDALAQEQQKVLSETRETFVSNPDSQLAELWKDNNFMQVAITWCQLTFTWNVDGYLDIIWGENIIIWTVLLCHCSFTVYQFMFESIICHFVWIIYLFQDCLRSGVTDGAKKWYVLIENKLDLSFVNDHLFHDQHNHHQENYKSDHLSMCGQYE